jgi:hypothetical protein
MLSAAAPAAGPLFFILLIGLLFLAFRWYSRPKRQIEQRKRELELLKQSEGVDYITVGLLVPPDQEVLTQLQDSVDAILGSPLHRSGQLLDTTRNTVVLRDLEWQIASDLLKASEAARDLKKIGAPRSEQEQANLAHQRATRAIQQLRADADRRVQAIRGYAIRVRKAQLFIEDSERVGEYDRIADKLLTESAGGHQQDEALNSLADAQKDAQKIALIHDELGL